MNHSFWTQDNPSLEDSEIELIVKHGFKELWFTIGTFNGTSQMTYWGTEPNIAPAVLKAHQRNLDILGVMINTFTYQKAMNVNDYPLVVAVVAEVKRIVVKYHLDGWVDGAENFTGSIENLIRYLRLQAEAMASIGCKFYFCQQAWIGMSNDRWKIYSYDPEADASSPMFYDTVNPPAFKPAVHRVLNTSPVNVVPGFAFRSTHATTLTFTLKDELDMLDSVMAENPNAKKIIGVNLWFQGSLSKITPEEWEYWDDWLAEEPTPPTDPCAEYKQTIKNLEAQISGLIDGIDNAKKILASLEY